MTLLQEAEKAEKIRNSFIVFSEPCRNHVTDLNKAISELSYLSCSLREIDSLIKDDDGTGLDLIREDLQCVHEDVTFTLDDIWRCIGRMSLDLTPEDYQNAWDEIVEVVEEDSKGSVDKVLQHYKLYIDSLCKKLEDHITTPTIETLRGEMQDINIRGKTKQQMNRSPSKSKASPIKTRAPPTTLPRTNSFRKPPQPSAPKTSLKVNTPQSPTLKKSYERERPLSPAESNASSATDATRFRVKPPWAPSPPTSPTATMSSISAVSSAGSVETSPKHWAQTVFTNMSSTLYGRCDEETRYHQQRNTKELTFPSNEYEKVLRLSYPEGVHISLHCRLSDYRAKIVAIYHDSSGAQDYGCLNMEDLQVRREGPVLRFYRRGSSGKLVRWVSMKFTTYERQILFACTFIAMRSQDGSIQEPAAISDDELRDEVCQFSGIVVDSNFSHALRIWRDKVTRSIRLQASVLHGELDRTPVWTAFITRAISSPDWCRQVDKRTVALADLTPHIFSARYRPQLTPSDGFKLQFETRDDAEAFVEVIETLREGDAGHRRSLIRH